MEEYVIEEWEHAGHTIKIIADNDGSVESPREDDYNTTKMVCFHSRYTLGDEGVISQGELDDAGCGSWGDVGRYLEARHGAIMKLPLWLYDHSGLSMRAGRDFHGIDPQGWDSGVVGFIFHTEASIREQFCIPEDEPIPDETRKLAMEGMEFEVQYYSCWLEGDCFGYRIEDKDGDEVGSCWGYIGWDLQEESLKSECNAIAEYAQKERWERNGAALMQRTLQEVML